MFNQNSSINLWYLRNPLFESETTVMNLKPFITDERRFYFFLYFYFEKNISLSPVMQMASSLRRILLNNGTEILNDKCNIKSV